MKSNSDNRPSTILNLGDGTYQFHYNIVEKIEEGRTSYDSDVIILSHPVSRDNIIDALIRERYSLSQELSISRQKDKKADEYNAYYEYCEECKRIAVI